MDFQFGSSVVLRKPHPCGGYQWRIERLGIDIGIRCLKCNHYILTSRQKLARNILKLKDGHRD